MKTLKTLLASTVVASLTLSVSAQAKQLWDDALYNMIYHDSANTVYSSHNKRTVQEKIFSLHDDYNKNAVWSYEFEQYVNPADLQRSELASIDEINHYMGQNPTAAGDHGRPVFIYDKTAGDYHLQY